MRPSGTLAAGPAPRTFGVLLAAWLPLAANAQLGNPFDGDAAAIRAGGALFASRCADCHGADAKGAQGPDLTELWAVGTSDQRLFDSVRDGIGGSIMPPSVAPDNEIWAVIAYLKSISTVPPFENVRGDFNAGHRLFETACTECHSVAGHGGALGPNLSLIAQVRSREAIVQSIRDPSASIGVGYRVVTLVRRDGERVEGVVKAEDAFSIQIVDSNGRLQGYTKAELEEIVREDRSLMPEFGPEDLSASQLDDLLAYIATLRSDGGR